MIVKIDSREKFNWTFIQYGLQEEVGKLQVGDYSIVGHEDKISIERKRTTGELYINLIKDYKRFAKELTILADYEVKYIICEFPLNYIYTFPAHSGIPSHLWSKLRCNSQLLSSRIEKIYNEFEIPIIFSVSAGDAQDKAYQILKDYALTRTT